MLRVPHPQVENTVQLTHDVKSMLGKPAEDLTMSSFLLWRLSHRRQALSAPPNATTEALPAAAAMQ